VLSSPHATQLSALRRVPYESKRVVLHTDASLMPANTRDWSPLNLFVDAADDAASVTVWMNQIDDDLRTALPAPLFQTWNPCVEPDPSTVVADYAFERPVVTAASVEAIAELQAANGHGHMWFVGAYSRYSMPLLENGVKSAMVVARSLGVDTSDVEFDEARAIAAGRSSALLLSIVALVVVVSATCLHALLAA